MTFSECPRCGCETYERYMSHSYCFECNYSPDLDWTREPNREVEIPQWAVDALRETESLIRPQLKAGGIR